MMSSPTWTRPRTSLVLALAIVTAAACIKPSHAQDLFQGIEQITVPFAQIWPEYKTDIEQQTEDFKKTTLGQIRALVDMITFNEMAETLARILPALRSDIEEQTKNAKGTTQEKIKALVDMIICKKSVICGKSKVAIDLVPRRRQDNSESILIIENSQKESDISHWKMSLNDVIRRWDDYASECSPKECSEDNPAIIENAEACNFNTQWLGPHCSDDGNWGYVGKSPCIIVEMNKIAEWRPDVYRSTDELPTDMPEVLKTHIKQQTNFTYFSNYNHAGTFSDMLWLNCKGQTPADDENIGEIEYTPWQGFPAYYFPYIEHHEYCWIAPLVAVRFINPTKNVLINVECRVYAKDISYSRYDSPDSVYGVMNFELLID